jgi:hypothetical protein
MGCGYINRFAFFLFSMLPLACPTDAVGERITLGPFQTVPGEYSVTFDSSSIPLEQMKGLVRLSPQLSWEYIVPPSLELCVTGDPKYLECGTRDLRAPHFLENAKINLDEGRGSLKKLQSLTYPKELGRVVAYLKDSLAFSLWLHETRYEFYKSWDTEILKRRYRDLDPSKVCAGELRDIAAAVSKEDKYRLSFQWWKCVNNLYRSRLGDYPLQDWKTFISTYRIEEGTPVERLFEQASEFERSEAYEKATQLYLKIVKEYPEAIREDEIESMRYSDIANDRLRVIQCRQSRGKDLVAQRPEELSRKVKEALLAKDKAKLVRLASCDFDVGLLESDYIFSIQPSTFIEILSRNIPLLDFSSPQLSQESADRWFWQVSDKSRSERYAFYFRKLENGWVWFLFATSSGSLLEALNRAKHKASQ